VSDLQAWAAEFGIALSATQLAQFDTYRELLLLWNQRINLTAITEPAEIDSRHFLDSLTVATVTGDLSGQSLIDVGTGAGFPGVPLKILYPEMQLTLVDSVAKKTRFLELLVGELGLTDFTVRAERVETLGHERAYREQFDWAVARAVAHLRVLAEYLLPLVRVGGAMLVQKGTSAVEESAESTAALAQLGGSQPTITPVQLPNRPILHYILQCNKLETTASLYPRRVGVPQKRPL
jgi:16S rRNA (guanine527-N7)-methyltransferase